MMPVNKKDATFRGIIDALPELLYHKGRLHILADREHSFWRNVNAVSGFA